METKGVQKMEYGKNDVEELGESPMLTDGVCPHGKQYGY